MQRIDNRFVYSASDLNNALECAHLVELERLVAAAERERPEATPGTDLLARKGEEHERHQLERYRERYGAALVEFDARVGRTIEDLARAHERTAEAMASGAPLIYQATFFDGTWMGRTDFLRRVERPCARWAWSYEVVDTKLGLSPKPYYLIQLANYSEHIARVQGTPPQAMHVVLGSGAERSFRVDDFSAYYRSLKRRFMERMATIDVPAYPLETSHCTVCRWNAECSAQRSLDDHLSLVAGMRKDQMRRFEAAGITTMAQLARTTDDARPFGLSLHSFEKLRAQAALQHRARVEKRHFYELLEQDAHSGFALLPAPDEGDVFFDMEGDPLYAADHGLEYLFGSYCNSGDAFVPFWARSDREEKAAFEAFIDFVTERRARYPGMHVYHYANYEQAALRRLMGRYGTREAELDALLRGEVFVDLYTVARQSLRISQPSYSIKKFETFYGMQRATDVKRGDDSIVMFETWLFNGDESILEDIERYNEDDCRSTYLLREWLLERRAEYARTHEIAWFTQRQEEAQQTQPEDPELATALLADVDPPHSLRSLRAAPADARARWLLGHLLEYDRRDAKPAWWQLYDRYKNLDRLLEFDHEALAGLMHRSDIPPEKDKQSYIHTYAFPEQLHHLEGSVMCAHTQSTAGTIVSIDDEQRLLRIKLNKNIVPAALRAIVPGRPITNPEQRKTLRRIATAYLDGTLAQRWPATRALLLAQPQPVLDEGVAEAVPRLDGSYLFVQGPPGSGKSTVGAAVIVDALAAGKRVGIVAKGHKAIHHLLRKVEDEALARGVRFTGLKKCTGSNEDSVYHSRLTAPMITSVNKNEPFVSEPHQLAAGTPWLFAREELSGAYDLLFVDEAGQISLADALACSLSARNVVLLGDPLQLAQVSQGSHPVGTDLSILEHALGDHDTVPPGRGIFLDVSYRMQPEICAFISEHVYEGRLRSAPGTRTNAVLRGDFVHAGLEWLPVEHEGNGRSSQEEANAIARAIESMRGARVCVRGEERALTVDDIIVVSPYNAQRVMLRRTLADAGLGEVRIGTVDKFQGQEAPVVFYSMATSSGEDIPRDLAFLFERNRFNVALSRAQCLSILVCSPELLSVRCSSPEQMALVNLLCAFVEAASQSMTMTILPVDEPVSS